MKTRSKALLLSLCGVLLVATSVIGTMAYLTDKDSVINTFTVGNVSLKLDEADVKPDGTLNTDNRVKDNQYHLLPGHRYTKDPTVTVGAGSEDAYVRMIVSVERIDQLKKALPKYDSEGKELEANKKYYNEELFLIQMLCEGWEKDIWVYAGYTEIEIDSSTGAATGNYEFRYAGNEKDEQGKPTGIVVKSEKETILEPLFKVITVPGEMDNTHLAYLENVKIRVAANAMQADGFDTAEEAWEVFK